MKVYLARRLARAVFLLFAVSLLCFLLTRLAPGSFFDEIRLNPQISPQTIAALQERYGLNQPLPLRYAHWLGSMARGDFGFSIAYNTPVSRLMWAPAEHTLLLGGIAMLLCWLISVPLAVWSARYERSFFDRGISAVTSLFISVPEIVLAVGLLALVVRSHALPVGGLTSVGFDDLSAWGKAAGSWALSLGSRAEGFGLESTGFKALPCLELHREQSARKRHQFHRSPRPTPGPDADSSSARWQVGGVVAKRRLRA